MAHRPARSQPHDAGATAASLAGSSSPTRATVPPAGTSSPMSTVALSTADPDRRHRGDRCAVPVPQRPGPSPAGPRTSLWLLPALIAAGCTSPTAPAPTAPSPTAPTPTAPTPTAPSPTTSPSPTPAAPAPPTANPAAMDRAPAGVLRSPRWEARVAEGGALTVTSVGDAADALTLDREVDPRLAFSPDDTALYYARRGALGETDLWRVDLPSGQRRPVTTWLGSEDRPVVSPDGRRLAFVSGRTGIASWWVVSLDGPLPAATGTQLTNVGVEAKPRSPGHPPEGFVPVPDGTTYAWTDAGLTWESRGQPYTVAVPP